MYILMKDLYKELNQYAKVLIYGAGYYANTFYQTLKKLGLKEIIDSFIVTNLNGVMDIDGITVKQIHELELCNKDKNVIVIAAGGEYEAEIFHTLQDLQIVNVIKLSDYIIQDDMLSKIMRDESDKQFLADVIEKYIWSHTTSISEVEDRGKEIEHKIMLRNQKEIDRNTIVFISGDISSRSEKIIGALIRKGFHIIALEYGGHNELIEKEQFSHKVKFFQCKDITEVFCIAMMYRPLVFYCEPMWGNCDAIEIMIRHKKLFGKIIFSPYDILNDGYVRIAEQQKMIERYCFENADGIVWRWFSKEFLEEKKGLHIKGKSIQFLDYCRGFNVVNDDQKDNKLKLCFVQGMIYDLLDETIRKNDGKYIEMARIDTILNKIGKREDCIFHIFIGKCNGRDREKLNLLESKYPNFKVFYETKYHELITRISKYDYGSFFYTSGEEIPDLVSIDDVYYGSIYNNGIQSRYFDYLDAGIPIIATRSKKLCDYLDKLGVLIRMDISNIDIDYLKKNKMFYKKNVEKIKAQVLIDNHIQELIDFFEEL